MPLLLLMALSGPAHALPDVAVAAHAEDMVHPSLSGRVALGLPGPLKLEAEAIGVWSPEPTPFVLRGGPAVKITGPNGGRYGAFLHTGFQRGTWGDLTAGIELGHTLKLPLVEAWFVRPQVRLPVALPSDSVAGVALQAGIVF